MGLKLLIRDEDKVLDEDMSAKDSCWSILIHDGGVDGKKAEGDALALWNWSLDILRLLRIQVPHQPLCIFMSFMPGVGE